MKCDKAFSQRSSLRTHELSHQSGLIRETYVLLCTSQKQHPCIKCDKSFSQRSSEIESKIKKSEEKFIEHRFDMTSINRSCYFRMIPIMQWTKFRVEI